MDYVFRRSYRGQLKAVILDWAGTTVDFGSFAPTAVFIRLFESRGVPITIEQARRPMGLMKRDHLKAILSDPVVSQAWQQVHGGPHTDQDIQGMFADFVELQKACLAEYAEPIPGLFDAVDDFCSRNMKIGSTTGYTRDMMDILLPEAEKRGYCPDACVCPDDVPGGRPYPWMCYQNAILLQTFPMEAMVKIGDTLPDIEEGLNAGMWTIGVALTGNLLGLSQAEVKALPKETLQSRRKEIYARLYQAGAHFVVDSIGDVPVVLDDIQLNIAQGIKP
jgi:phosphonoacetaldehyde hydrolase